MIKADLHIHTCYSIDCLMPLEQIVERCLELGINCIAVADHNTIRGALKLKEIAPFRVIVAEEILTPAGEIMGLFLNEAVPKGLSPHEAISQIRSQGGLVGIPHPFGRPFFWNGDTLTSAEVLSRVDIVETLNARTPSSRSIARAWRLAKEHGKVASAGSDAHTPGEIGRAYVEMPEFDGPDDFLSCLAQGRVLGRKSSSLVHLSSVWARIRKRTPGHSWPSLL